MADDTIKLHFELGYRPESSGGTNVTQTGGALQQVEADFQGFITSVETGALTSGSATSYLHQFDHIGHSDGEERFSGVIEIPLKTPVGHLFLEHGYCVDGIWTLTEIHRGSIITIITPSLYYPSSDLGVDSVYSIVLTSIEYEGTNYNAQFQTTFRGPGGATVRIFDATSAPYQSAQ